MFDHLDDPNPPQAGPEARAAVAERVAYRHRLRQARVITGIAVVVIVGLAIALPVALRSGSHQTAKSVGPAGQAPPSRVAFSTVFDLQFATAENGWALGKAPTRQALLAATSDGGKTWRPARLPNGSVTSVRPNRDGSVVVFSSDRAFVSRDGGASWTPVTGLNGNIVDMSASGSTMWALVSQCPAGSPSCRPILWVSNDAGRTWHIPEAQPVMGNRDGQVAAASPSSGWVVSLDTSGTQREPVVSWLTSDGKSWFSTAGQVSVPECLDVRVAAAFGTNLELLCNSADGSGWKMLSTVDAGHTWALSPLRTVPRTVPLPAPPDPTSSDQMPLYRCIDSNRCWMVLPGPSGAPYVWRTTDGISWAAARLP